jgi:hypothetical protein
MTWREQALCAGHPNPALWFADNARDMRAAVVICRSCPVGTGVSGLGRVHPPARRRVGRDDAGGAAPSTTTLGVAAAGLDPVTGPHVRPRCIMEGWIGEPTIGTA